jgi:uncharacterized protein (TIGR02145 family)/prepilin-type N-terminal cleavage/methylation domain-containing protein
MIINLIIHKKIMKQKQKAFTLIELLVVIAIIGILATLAVVALQQARQNARDAKRVADVKQLSTALELYFNDNQSYPETVEELQTEGYMEQLPEAPTPADEGCLPEENEYIYTVDEERGDYEISFCTGKQVSDMSPGLLCMTSGGLTTDCTGGAEATSGTFIDARDGQEYAWAKFGDQTWMAENLNYDNGCFSITWVDDSDEGWCGYYDNDETTYSVYGMLYQWSAAMNGTTTEGAQGICPDGWHLPTDAEWTTLTNYVIAETDAETSTVARWLKSCRQVDNVNASACLNPLGGAGTNTPDHPRWNSNASHYGINAYNFSAFPTGFRTVNGNFGSFGVACFWSSYSSVSFAWARLLTSSGSGVDRFGDSFANGFSVRCLQD